MQEFANKLKGKQKKNAQKFMTYMKKTWQKSYPPKTWNYFMYSGATTNNHQEGYNSRLNNTKNLKANGNPYLLLKVIVQELKISENKVISAGVKNVKKSTNTKNKTLLERRKRLMAGIHDSRRDTDLATYMKAIGSCSLKYEDRIKVISNESELDQDLYFDTTLEDISADFENEISKRKSVEGEDLRNVRERNEINSIIAEEINESTATPAPTPSY